MDKKESSIKFFERRFELKHLTVLLLSLIIFQIILSLNQKESLNKFLTQTQKWYQQDSAEKLANLTTTSLELILENFNLIDPLHEEQKRKLIQSFDIILSQQQLQQNVIQNCLILVRHDSLFAIDDGNDLYHFLSNPEGSYTPDRKEIYHDAIMIYSRVNNQIKESLEIYTEIEGEQTYNIFVPFTPSGEYLGGFYMKNKPNFEFISREVKASFDEISIIYISIILLGLLSIYYISSYTVKERNKTQQLLLKEQEEHLKKQIIHEKESSFTKRIYHTHHKAEKVMGFIKEDLRKLSTSNIDEIKERVTKYSNFVSRVIYHMKWYDPPVQTIRSSIFSTDLNSVLTFLTDNLFLRISSKSNMFRFVLNLDEKLPRVNVNEFVIWEIFEPLIQNSIDHANVKNVVITISSNYDPEIMKSVITISDNGKGIEPKLLEITDDGVKKLFHEDISTKSPSAQNSGYGCYIAYTMAVLRCGWKLDVHNNEEAGCSFVISISNN